MNNFSTFLQHCIQICNNLLAIINSVQFFVILNLISFIILSKITKDLVKSFLNNPKALRKKQALMFFIIPIIAILIENISSSSLYFYPKTTATRSLLCLAWMLSCFKFHSLFLFLEKITEEKFKICNTHKILFLFETLLCCGFIIDLYSLISHGNRIPHHNILNYSAITLWISSIIPSIVTIIKKIYSINGPIILKKQLKILLLSLFLPHIICILLEFSKPIYYGIFKSSYQILAFSNIAMILITAALYFCYKQIMQFRFLNFSNHTKPKDIFTVSADFKDIIEQLNLANNKEELALITEEFFKKQFNINKKLITLYFREEHTISTSPFKRKIEQFLNDETEFNPTQKLLYSKVITKAEIEFDYFCTQSFHEKNKFIHNILHFLTTNNLEIFLPIIHNKQIIAYIAIADNFAETIYSVEELNKMIVYSQFIAPSIHILSQRNIYNLISKSKDLSEDLHKKNQEIKQYEESIKKLIKDRIENNLGIIYYRNHHFSYKNPEAEKLIGIDLNLEKRHSTRTILLNISKQVEQFKTTQSSCINIHDGKKLMIQAMPSTGPNEGVLLAIRKPEPTDIIKLQIDSINDPSKRDYLLYLETTKAGKVINDLIPSNKKTFLDLKIELLQASLQRKALLLQADENDTENIARLIHEISLKSHMHILDLQGKDQIDNQIKIFGINPLLQTMEHPHLLEDLNDGTLLIKNFELLDFASQDKLAYFIKYGIYKSVKCERKQFSDVRIICSTNRKISNLLEKHMISKDLLEELQKSSLPTKLSERANEEEIENLIEGFMLQSLRNNELTPLSLKDKKDLAGRNLNSILELRRKVHNIMIRNTREKPVSKERICSEPEFNTDCPYLKAASKLGKLALKDKDLLENLWKQLQSQAKIAALLGVNRSSVNRRFKLYKFN